MLSPLARFGVLAAAIGRVRVALVYAALAGVLALAGAGLLVAALYLWLATLLPPASAALIVGAVLLLAAVAVAALGRLVLRARRPLAVPPPAASVIAGGGIASDAAATAAMLGNELGVAGGAWARAHLPQVAAAALAAGFLIGFSPRLRRALRRGLSGRPAAHR